MTTLNTDSFEIKNYELTPQGFLKCWIVGGIAGKELIYDGGRKEIIQEDALFDEKSINSAIGKPITFNHPPQAINSKNYKKYSNGMVLQEYAKDSETGALVLAGIIHDADIVEGVMSGKIKYISAGYTADKHLNSDGILIQTNRQYDHFATLSEEFLPRAGDQSKVIINNENVDNAEVSTKNIKMNIQERVELLTSWRHVLEKNNKAINYDASPREIKKQILEIFYPEKTMKLITDENIDGVWVGFQINQDSQERNTYQESKSPDLNFDSAVDEAVKAFVKKIEGN